MSPISNIEFRPLFFWVTFLFCFFPVGRLLLRKDIAQADLKLITSQDDLELLSLLSLPPKCFRISNVLITFYLFCVCNVCKCVGMEVRGQFPRVPLSPSIMRVPRIEEPSERPCQ